MATIRCFVGIPLPEHISQPLLVACEAIRSADPSWFDARWVAAQNLHVTLHFIGPVEESELGTLTRALDAEVDFDPFELPLEGIAAVPGPRRARMIWGTLLDPEGACARLAEQVERAALAVGAAPDERAFKPHVTLCRAKRPQPLSAIALEDAQACLNGPGGKMSVARATLFSSRLSPRGPVYTALRDWHARGE